MSAVTKISFRDGDDGGDLASPTSIQINVVDNGFVVQIVFEDGDEMTEVYHDIDDIFKRIKEVL